MSTVILALFFIGLGVAFVWGIKEIWNTPPQKKFIRKY
jgi:hypothetical protein